MGNGRAAAQGPLEEISLREGKSDRGPESAQESARIGGTNAREGPARAPVLSTPSRCATKFVVHLFQPPSAEMSDSSIYLRIITQLYIQLFIQ